MDLRITGQTFIVVLRKNQPPMEVISDAEEVFHIA